MGLLLFMVACYYAVWAGEYSLLDLRRIQLQQETEAARIEVASASVDSLHALTTALESDPAAIEAVARERFGLIRPGEVLYRFVEVDSAVASPPATDSAAAP